MRMARAMRSPRFRFPSCFPSSTAPATGMHCLRRAVNVNRHRYGTSSHLPGLSKRVRTTVLCITFDSCDMLSPDTEILLHVLLTYPWSRWNSTFPSLASLTIPSSGLLDTLILIVLAAADVEFLAQLLSRIDAS